MRNYPFCRCCCCCCCCCCCLYQSLSHAFGVIRVHRVQPLSMNLSRVTSKCVLSHEDNPTLTDACVERGTGYRP
jgi:hypothetical protein